ncbi:hypothetical protein MSG28_007802, partial [Choristoneura fumiferana]
VESTHYSTQRIPFPAVMVCETQLVYGPNAGNISHVFKNAPRNTTFIPGKVATEGLDITLNGQQMFVNGTNTTEGSLLKKPMQI